tara:strand:+ start:7329 stop:9545 length:2217 start_codon:yes stop_codon:yes gene_type:complete
MDWMDARAAVQEGAGTTGPAPVEGLLEVLNEPQRAAVEHTSGPLLILAGPGSGKTRVITSRLVHLVTTQHVQPSEILAITFTNKAAREMRERVEKLLPDVKGFWISTFHAFCARFLRQEIEILPSFTRDFTIFDTSERNALIKACVKELNFDATRFRPAAIGGWISATKNSVAGEDGGLELTLGDASGMEDEVFRKVKRRYEERLREQNALDFDDLLLHTLAIFDAHPGLRDAWSYRFRYVMVDEYQDTNRVQYRLTRHLSDAHGNLAVVGDPDQSIYSWRGADVRNFLDFEKDMGGATVVRLEQNYRSTGTILAAASAVIEHNSQRKVKELWTQAEDGDQLVLMACGDENDEAREIVAQIRSLQARGRAWGEVAIFYRMNFMQRALESALRLAAVPYQIVGGTEFYGRREVRDLVSWLRLIVNPRDDQAFLRVVNAPTRGVGATSLGRLAEWAADRRVSYLEAARSEECLSTIRGRAKKGLPEFAATVEELAHRADDEAGLALEAVLESFDRTRWLNEIDDGDSVMDRDANVEELCTHAREYDKLNPAGKLRGFLQDVALVSDTDGLEQGDDAVKLMTLHACKGLEFPFVFIAGCEEELLPHARALEEDPEHGIEEERRLFYVGLTRARERLMLTNARTRGFFGEDRWMRPSQFLDELPSDLIEGMDEEANEALGTFEPASSGDENLKVGARIYHDHFGEGYIENLSGQGVNARARVRFDHHGTKELLLHYANLSLL